MGPLDLFGDLAIVDALPERSAYVRNCIATIVSNKWVAELGNSGWDDAVASMLAGLSEKQLPGLSPAMYARYVAFATGGIARLDKKIKAVAAPLGRAPASCPGGGGAQMARLLGTVVSPKEYLAPENHVVIRPIYKQWVYAHVARPLIPLAFPISQDVPQATLHAASLVALLKDTPFAVYEDDVESLARILIAGMTTLPDWSDVAVAFRILSEIIADQSSALQGPSEAHSGGRHEGVQCCIDLDNERRDRRRHTPATAGRLPATGCASAVVPAAEVRPSLLATLLEVGVPHVVGGVRGFGQAGPRGRPGCTGELGRCCLRLASLALGHGIPQT